MSRQVLNFALSGLNLSQSDYNGAPAGSLVIADNVESLYPNIMQPRRGFDAIPNTAIPGQEFLRITNYLVNLIPSIIAIPTNRVLKYFNLISNTWNLLPVAFPDWLTVNNPNIPYANSRFVEAGQVLYVTAADGPRSLPSGDGSFLLRAGVPKATTITAALSADVSGFLQQNVILNTVGSVGNGNPIVFAVINMSGVSPGNYVSGNSIPEGSAVSQIISGGTPSLIIAGSTTAGSPTITVSSPTAGVSSYDVATGGGIPSNAFVTTVFPNTSIALNVNAYQTTTNELISFSTPSSFSMTNAGTADATEEPITFYTGSQVAYKALFGRVDEFPNTLATDNQGQITRLGSPTPTPAIVTNFLAHSTNVNVKVLIPHEAQSRATFIQIYRSPQTTSSLIPPLDQYTLIYENELTAADYLAGFVEITDQTVESIALEGIKLYTGADQQGAGQANDPPPMSWDMTPFRDFMVYGNVTFPSTFDFAILAIQGLLGLQIGDTITISGTFNGYFSQIAFTASTVEDPTLYLFQLFTAGSPGQNVTDTSNSFVRVINASSGPSLPVHAYYSSSLDDLPGKILLEADNPSTDQFTITSNNATAFDPPLISSPPSQINTFPNQIAVSKIGELEAVPALNTYNVGDASSPIIRVIAMRDYVLVIKLDGIYKVLGADPKNLQVSTFDLTCQIVAPDSAVKLASAVWMWSSQGIVQINDSGVKLMSVPIDNVLNDLIQQFSDNIILSSFALGYDEERKFVLFTPQSVNAFAEIEYVYNTVSNTWSTWSRHVVSAFIHSQDKKLYIGRLDLTDQSISKQRGGSSNPLLDYSDEAGVPYNCQIQWKQIVSDNAAFQRQYSEGIILFKQASFTGPTLTFSTDYSLPTETLNLSPQNSLITPITERFYIPQQKQMGTWIIPTFQMNQANGFFILQGLSISYENMSDQTGFS